MSANKVNSQYEVLCPWADVDPLPLKGIMPRVTDLAGKKIGFSTNKKVAAEKILSVVERRLKERFPTCETSWFKGLTFSISEFEKERVPEYKEWINGLDTVVVANAD